MGRIIAIANQKGGVGKTTTSINLSACLAEAGKKILVIDLDPQGNTTSGFGIDKEEMDHTVYELILDECTVKQSIHKTEIENLKAILVVLENDISKNNSLAFVLIDEVDFFTLNRHQENADAIKRVLLTFNKIVDKLLFDNFINKIIIVGTTNLRDSIDVSVLRRFYFHENFDICLKQENLIELIERLSKIVPKYRKTDVEELFEICSEKKYTLGEIKNILAENYLKSKINNTRIMDIETFKKRESLYDILNKQKGIIKNGR